MKFKIKNANEQKERVIEWELRKGGELHGEIELYANDVHVISIYPTGTVYVHHTTSTISDNTKQLSLDLDSLVGGE